MSLQYLCLPLCPTSFPTVQDVKLTVAHYGFPVALLTSHHGYCPYFLQTDGSNKPGPDKRHHLVHPITLCHQYEQLYYENTKIGGLCLNQHS